MSQNNGGLNWDQLQMPSFSGSMDGLATSANMLDKALGRLRGMNDQVGEMRSDEQEKLLLQNIMGAASGQAALDGLGDGSLLANLDMKRLSNEALRNVYKDIGNRLNTEGLGIKNTQGLLDHDLTRANTANANARTQSTLASIAEATANQNREASNREYSNIVANRVMNMNPAERSAWLQGDEHRGLMNQYGQGMSAFDSALASIDKSAATHSNVAEYNAKAKTQEIADFKDLFTKELDVINSSSNTVEERDDIVNSLIPNLDPTSQRLAKEVMNDKNIPYYNNLVQSDQLSGLSTDLQTLVGNIAEEDLNTSYGSIDSITAPTANDLMNPPTREDLNKRFEDDLLKGELIIGSDPNVYLDVQYANKLQNVADKAINGNLPSEGNQADFDLYNAEMVGDYRSDSSFISNRAAQSTVLGSKRKHYPYSEEDHQILAKEAPELLNKPMSASNIEKANSVIRDSKYRNNSETRFNDYYEDINKRVSDYMSKNVQEARELGIPEHQIYMYAENKSVTEAMQQKNGESRASKMKLSNKDQSLVDDAKFISNYTKEPTKYGNALKAEQNSYIDVATRGTKGALYVETSSMSEVPNNITDVGASVAKSLGKDKSTKYVDILAEMQADFPSTDARLLGSVLKSMGGEYDKEEATKKINNYSSPNQAIYESTIKDYRVKSDQLMEALDKITTSINSLDRNKRLSPEQKEKQLAQYEVQQSALIRAMISIRGDLKSDVDMLFNSDN